MNTNNLNTALYEKMATEQEKYRDYQLQMVKVTVVEPNI